MERIGLRCLALIVVPLILSMTLSCDNDEELICCRCTCFTVIDSTLGTEDVKDEDVSGKGISCEAECRHHCETINWEIRYHARIDCDQAGQNKDTSR